MSLNYSLRAQKILDSAAPAVAFKFMASAIEPEHLLFAILSEADSIAVKSLNYLGVNLRKVMTDLETYLTEIRPLVRPASQDLAFSASSMEIFAIAEEEARLMMGDIIGTEHILLGIVKFKGTRSFDILAKNKVSYAPLQDEIYNLLGVPYPFPPEEEGGAEVPESAEQSDTESGPARARGQARGTRLIDRFCTDLNQMAKASRLDPVIGRTAEMTRIIEILCRRVKNNPVLLGDPGVGKTAIVEGISQRIVDGRVPRGLKGKRLLTLDLASVVAGTKYRGEFEDRLKKIIAEALHERDIILFIDEFHTLLGAGSAEGSLDAANILKPVLARGEIQIIGATTLSEFRKYVEKDKAMARRVQPVVIEEPGESETLGILEGIKHRYEEFHKVVYSQDSLVAALELSRRFITDRHLPDKAIDLMDEAGSKTRSSLAVEPLEAADIRREIARLEEEKRQLAGGQRFEDAIVRRDRIQKLHDKLNALNAAWEKEQDETVITITREHVEQVLAQWLKIPVEQLSVSEQRRLLTMESWLGARVLGQQEAVRAMADAVRRSRLDIRNPDRPSASFFFLGPTGTGKTLTARLLAEFLFSNADRLIRVDMSEFTEKFNASRLIGAPPGYVGYEEGGLLTERVRKAPYSVVLFDEFEKAHPDVHHLLLQILEAGRLTDSFGQTVDFRNTIIIATSNVGTRELENEPLGFDSGPRSAPVDAILKKALRKQFSPELLNRFDSIITFRPFDAKTIAAILERELEILKTRLVRAKVSLSVTPPALRKLEELSFDPRSGARKVLRVLQDEVESRLSQALIGLEDRSRPTSFSLTFETGAFRLSPGRRTGGGAALKA